MTKQNGTDAKTIALHFLDLTTDGRNPRVVIAKTINQVKALLSLGYTAEEIIATINHIIDSGMIPYSFGYINASIQNVLREINKKKVEEEAEEQKRIMMEEAKVKQGEVNVGGESTERNRQKAERISLQSGLGKKYNFDMFEGQ